MKLETIMRSLGNQIAGIEAGKIDPKRANALCNTVGKYIGCVRVNMELAKMLGVKPQIKPISDALPAPRRKK